MDTMEANLCFPLHPSITRLLVEWNITITQLKLNGWHIVMSILTLFGKMKPQYYPTVSELGRLVHLSRPLGEKGWLFMQANKCCKMVEEVTTKSKIGTINFGSLGVIGGVPLRLVSRVLALTSQQILGNFEVSLPFSYYQLSTDF